jgi:preprotein translocase subunit SecA
LREQVVSMLAHVELRVQRGEDPAQATAPPPPPRGIETREDPMLAPAPAPRAPRPGGPAAPWARTPRNAPCPCGSGKKYKHCHGRVV